MSSLKTQKAEELKDEILTYYSQEQTFDFAYDKWFNFQSQIIKLKQKEIMIFPRNANYRQYYQELLLNLDLTIDLFNTLSESYRNFVRTKLK